MCKKRSHDALSECHAQTQSKRLKIQRNSPLSLLDLSAKCVAEHIPFQRVEENFTRVPDPVQLRIVHWSFPRNEKDISMYSSLHGNNCHSEIKKLPFTKGDSLYKSGCVHDVLQVGFHLSGTVTEPNESTQLCPSNSSTYKVSICFDRCKITSVSCSCGSKDILWCPHVVALTLFRIRNADEVSLRVPISETLLQLNREQLQKILQYLIAEHHTEVLPTAQRLADEILQSNSEISRLHGAPDPTAGASVDDENCWHLDADQVQEQVRRYLLYTGQQNGSKQLHSMFTKVREMLRVQDTNGSRMLTLITEQFLADPRLHVWKKQGTAMTDKIRQLWDQLGSLWTCVVLNPDITDTQRDLWREQLQHWSSMPVCPLENPDKAEFEAGDKPREIEPRTVFSRALEACDLDWSDSILNAIINAEITEEVEPKWNESVSVAAARVDSLRTHGFPVKALRLTVATVRGMKNSLERSCMEVEHLLAKYSAEETEEILHEQNREKFTTEGWIGQSVDPIGVLYDTLLEVATKESVENKKEYGLTPVPGSKNDTYLSLALECALMGLGQQRVMPIGFYAQDNACRQEEHLIAQLNMLNFDSELTAVLIKQVKLLMSTGVFSGLGNCIHPQSVPMHTYVRFLFNILLPVKPELAFHVGLRALKFPGLGFNQGIEDEQTRQPCWFTVGHLESQQCELAACLLSASKGDSKRLSAVLRCIRQHVHSSAHLFRLAQDALKLATTDETCKDFDLISVAMELGLQVMRITLNAVNWRRKEIIQWLLSCAVEMGKSAVVGLLQSWNHLFTATETATIVAPTINAATITNKLHLTPLEQDTLTTRVRKVVLECAFKEPQACCLSALTLCEKDNQSFDAAYNIVLENSASFSPTHMFAVARYMEHLHSPQRAYKLTLLAMKNFSLAFNQDSHPSVGDIHWACALACSLGKAELTQIVPLVIKSVQCPTVLSDLLQSFALTSSDASLTFEELPLRYLLEASINAYVSTVHSRLNNISPRHYADFIEFLLKARETFHFAPSGRERFSVLLDNMRTMYKGKKKLLALLNERFC